MKKLRFIPVVLTAIIFTSCEKTETSCSDYNLEFTYSLSYYNSLYFNSAEVCYSDVSNDLPKGTEIEWNVNGEYSSFLQCATFRDNGKYSISMTATTPDGLQCSTYKEFEVDKIQIGL